jgi:hypothetical protein
MTCCQAQATRHRPTGATDQLLQQAGEGFSTQEDLQSQKEKLKSQLMC